MSVFGALRVSLPHGYRAGICAQQGRKGAVLGAVAIKQHMEAPVVRRFHQVHQLMGNHKVQAGGRIGGERGANTDGASRWRA